MLNEPYKKFFFVKIAEHDLEADWRGLTDDQLDSMEFAIEEGERILTRNCRENYGGVLMHRDCAVPLLFETKEAAQWAIKDSQLDGLSYCEELPIFASVEVVELTDEPDAGLREWLLGQIEWMRANGHNI